jgi:hypothetical protein
MLRREDGAIDLENAADITGDLAQALRFSQKG